MTFGIAACGNLSAIRPLLLTTGPSGLQNRRKDGSRATGTFGPIALQHARKGTITMSSNKTTSVDREDVRTSGSRWRLRGARNRFKAAAAGAAVLAAGLGMAALPAASASATAEFDDGTWAVATANFDCGPHEVDVIATPNEPLTGDFSVYFLASVYDKTSGSWTTFPNWTVADGITAQTFTTTSPGDTVSIQYAHMVNGTFVTVTDTVPVQDGLDDAPPFC